MGIADDATTVYNNGIGGSGREGPMSHSNPQFKRRDKVMLNDHPTRWGLPMDFDMSHVFSVVSQPIAIYYMGTPKWTAVVEYKGDRYQIYEDSLIPAPEK